MTREAFQKALEESPFTAVGEIVYKFLYDSIVTMDIQPGTTLNETKLAKEMGISRTPIRSAIDRLEADGLVGQEKGKAAVVLPLNSDEYYQIVELRAAIETQAAASAAKQISEADLLSLKKIVLDMEKRDRSENPYPVNDTMFHEIVIYSTHNPFLISAYDLYKAKMLRYRWFIHQNIPLSDYSHCIRVNVHRGIYNALKNRMSFQAREEAHEDAVMMRNTVLQL